MSTYRYILEPYRGMKTKHTCPSCGKAKVFVRYIDTATGDHLPFEYGKCDRSNNCSYHLSPYSSGYAKEAFQKERYYQDLLSPLPANTKKEQTELPTALSIQSTDIPFEVFKSSLLHYERNTFVQFLNQRLGPEMTQKLIERFYIGTSDYWPGATVFWIIDEQSKIRGGQVILFDNQGNTVKTDSLGRNHRHTSWVHIALMKKYQAQNITTPSWLNEYTKNSPKFPCLFGLPQLREEALNKPIAIVEAPKTAILATAYLPQLIWMAVGSISYLNAERLEAISGKNVILFPDKGAYTAWEQKSKELTHIANIRISDLLERNKVRQGSDLADFLTRHDHHQFGKGEVFNPEKPQTHQENGCIQVMNGPPHEPQLNKWGYPASWDT